jgi:hypothetical protein
VKSIFAGRPIIEVRAEQPVAAMSALDAMPEVEKTSLFGTAVHAVLRTREISIEEVRTRLRADGITVETIDAVPPSLEDVFLDVVDKAQNARPSGGAAA